MSRTEAKMQFEHPALTHFRRHPNAFRGKRLKPSLYRKKSRYVRLERLVILRSQKKNLKSDLPVLDRQQMARCVMNKRKSLIIIDN